MLMQAAKEHHINLEKSYIIGHELSDIEAGRCAGCLGILVLTGYGAEESLRVKDGDCLIAADLYGSGAENIYRIKEGDVTISSCSRRSV